MAGRRAGNESIEVFVGLLDANDRAAAHDREHSDRHGMLAVYLGSSLGAGKTSLPKPTSGERFLEVLEYDPLARIR